MYIFLLWISICIYLINIIDNCLFCVKESKKKILKGLFFMKIIVFLSCVVFVFE